MIPLLEKLPDFSLAEESARYGNIPFGALANVAALHRKIAASDVLSALTVECLNAMAVKKGNADGGKSFFSPVELECFRVLLVLLSFDAAKYNFLAAGYPEELFYETWSDLGHWGKHYLDAIGDLRFPAKIFNWFRLHVAGEIVQLGRLQFQMPDFCRFDADLSPFVAPGDPIVQCHIYEGAPLDFDACKESFRRLVRFMKCYRPDHDYRAIVSDSWLFDPALEALLPKGSNIMRFRSLGKIVPSEIPADTLWRVFGEKGPENTKNPTAFQKKVLDHLAGGGVFRYGFFVMPREDAEKL